MSALSPAESAFAELLERCRLPDIATRELLEMFLAQSTGLAANRIRVAHLEGMLILESRHALDLHAQRDELLEALEMVRDADNDRIADDGPQYGIPSQARAKIDAAIKKARGGK